MTDRLGEALARADLVREATAFGSVEARPEYLDFDVIVAAARAWHTLTENRIRQFAFDIVMTELGMDDSDPDDQADATEKVDAWMEHWRQGDTQ